MPIHTISAVFNMLKHSRSRIIDFSVILTCNFFLNCYLPLPDPRCLTEVHYDDELVGNWLTIRFTGEIGGVSFEPSLGMKIGNHWEFTASGEFIRRPGVDRLFRITQKGTFIECKNGKSNGVETKYLVEGNNLTLMIKYREGPNFVYLERDPAEKFKQ